MSERAIPIDSVQATAYTVPTDSLEADGTLAWNETTIVITRVRAKGVEGIGYTYSHAATCTLINTKLAEAVLGVDAMSISMAWQRMVEASRNLGRTGMVSCAIAAVDTAA